MPSSICVDRGPRGQGIVSTYGNFYALLWDGANLNFAAGDVYGAWNVLASYSGLSTDGGMTVVQTGRPTQEI